MNRLSSRDVLSKPSLSALMTALQTAEKRGPKNAPQGPITPVGTSAASDGGAVQPDPPVAATAGQEPTAPAPPAPSAPREDTKKTLRALTVRRFVTELLRPENRYNASQAYMKVVAHEGTNERSARANAVRYLAEEDVLAELDRQLKGIDASADLNEDYVYRHWRAIAQANIFQVLEINKDGVCTGFKTAPEDWSLEQQLSVTQISFHDNGKLKAIRLVDRQRAIENIAKARKMFVYDDSGTAVADMAKLITERMAAAAKRTGRTFDHETGRVL